MGQDQKGITRSSAKRQERSARSGTAPIRLVERSQRDPRAPRLQYAAPEVSGPDRRLGAR